MLIKLKMTKSILGISLTIGRATIYAQIFNCLSNKMKEMLTIEYE